MLRRKKLLAIGLSGIWIAASLFGGAGTIRAEQTGNAQNTDGGEITIHFTHYNARELTFDLGIDNGELSYTDAVLTYQDSSMDEPISLSLLSSDGSYTLYDLPEPVEELQGTFSVSMVTKPGYSLDLSQTSWNVNGQPVSDGGYVTITSSAASMSSTVFCETIPEQPAEETADPAVTEEETNPAANIQETQGSDSGSIKITEESPESDTVPIRATQETAGTSEADSHSADPSAAKTVTDTVSASPPLSSVPIASEYTPGDQIVPRENKSASAASTNASATISPAAEGSLANTSAGPESFSLRKLFQKTNTVLAIMILVIAVLILAELLRSIREDLRRKRYRRYM
ncbi:MAG: hypothetical protein ACI4EG_14545 [Fusicatenibacter sp.]